MCSKSDFIYNSCIRFLMSDLVNFYSLLPKTKKNDTPKGFKQHFIDKNSRILMIGSSGTGKSNAIMNFIEKTS